MPNKYPKSDTGPVYTNKKTGKKSLTRPKEMKEDITDPKVLFGSDYDMEEPLPTIIPDSAVEGKLMDQPHLNYMGAAKGKFIARGCGKVMNDRRKKTKMY